MLYMVLCAVFVCTVSCQSGATNLRAASKLIEKKSKHFILSLPLAPSANGPLYPTFFILKIDVVHRNFNACKNQQVVKHLISSRHTFKL